jgi:hypothetical protein
MLYNTTLVSIIETLCRTKLNDWKEGVATSGSTSTIVDTVGRDEPDDYFQSTSPVSYARILTTTDNLAPKGEERKASDFVNSTYTLSVTPNYTVTPGAGDTYAIYHIKRWADMVSYINSAIDMVRADVLVPKIDETSIILQDDVYEYPLPPDFTHLYRVTQQDADGNFYDNPVTPEHYSIVRAAPIPLLHFYKGCWFDSAHENGREIRLEGFGLQGKLVNDQDICYINPEWVVNQVAALIHASLSRRADNEPDDHATQYKMCQTIANGIRSSKGFSTLIPPDIKRIK